jgi:hypothetical protein
VSPRMSGRCVTMSERPGFPYDTEEARVDAELTRQELGETTQELVNRVKTTSQRMALRTAAATFVLIILILARRRGKRAKRS